MNNFSYAGLGMTARYFSGGFTSPRKFLPRCRNDVIFVRYATCLYIQPCETVGSVAIFFRKKSPDGIRVLCRMARVRFCEGPLFVAFMIRLCLSKFISAVLGLQELFSSVFASFVPLKRNALMQTGTCSFLGCPHLRLTYSGQQLNCVHRTPN